MIIQEFWCHLNDMGSNAISEQMISLIDLTAMGNDMNRHNGLG